MATEDKGQASEIEVELAVPANGTEEQKTPTNAEQQPPEDQDEDGEGVAQAGEDDDERSARAERRRRTRERNRIREMERDALIEQQGQALQVMYEQLQTLGAHAQGGQLTQAQQAHAAAKAQMAKAYESGNPQEVADATEALTIARLNLDALKHRRAPQPVRQPVADQGRAEAPNPYQQAWLSKNDWYNDPDRRRDASVAHAISASLADEGYQGEDLYVELDRELKKRGIAVEASGSQRSQPKVIVATGQRQSLGNPKTKVTLNPRVQEHAERFGINLKDPDTAKRIARRFQSQPSR